MSESLPEDGAVPFWLSPHPFLEPPPDDETS